MRQLFTDRVPVTVLSCLLYTSSDEERKNALKISQTLFESRTCAASHTVAETQKFVEDAIAAAVSYTHLDVYKRQGAYRVA